MKANVEPSTMWEITSTKHAWIIAGALAAVLRRASVWTDEHHQRTSLPRAEEDPCGIL